MTISASVAWTQILNKSSLIQLGTSLTHHKGFLTDPYKLLPKLFRDVSDKNFEIISGETELANGGAAMTAYARMQFSEMSEYEIKELRAALLKYCELDTLAMVMIYEGWREMIKTSNCTRSVKHENSNY